MLKLMGVLWLAFLATGCGQHNPVAPVTTADTTKHAQLYKPGSIIYEGIFGGWAGVKPWYWFDANDTPSYNAIIRTNANTQSANITRVTGGTWGKVTTFAMGYGNTANASVGVRIFVPSHSASVSWKLQVQEQNGQWRNWVLQSSTGYTGYKDYDLTSVLAAVNAGSGRFTLELVVEGGVGQYLEAAELYVFVQGAPLTLPYWWENFRVDAPYGANKHTAGWFDETTNPGFHATIENRPGHQGYVVGNPTLGGKVMSPVLPWKASECQILYITTHDSTYAFSVYIQEQSGQYRQWQVPKTWVDGAAFMCDLRGLIPLADGAPFSITLSDIYGPMWLFSSPSLRRAH
jgi:hypothetical protein